MLLARVTLSQHGEQKVSSIRSDKERLVCLHEMANWCSNCSSLSCLYGCCIFVSRWSVHARIHEEFGLNAQNCGRGEVPYFEIQKLQNCLSLNLVALKHLLNEIKRNNFIDNVPWHKGQFKKPRGSPIPMNCDNRCKVWLSLLCGSCVIVGIAVFLVVLHPQSQLSMATLNKHYIPVGCWWRIFVKVITVFG